MYLFYDDRDDSVHQRRGSRILYWLDDLGGIPINESLSDDEGYLFSVAGAISDYEDLVEDRPLILERAEDRLPLMSLASILDRMSNANVQVPMSRTWRLEWNDSLPEDLIYPLFVRASDSSLKLGGSVSRVRNASELQLEMEELRRLLGWNALVIVREWKECVQAGTSTYGPLPKEVRVWVIDGKPFAWSFQHIQAIPKPAGFPPSDKELTLLATFAEQVATAFSARCVVVDFALELERGWTFIDAGSGSSASTDHESVFKAVASKLVGKKFTSHSNAVGGVL